MKKEGVPQIEILGVQRAADGSVLQYAPLSIDNLGQLVVLSLGILDKKLAEGKSFYYIKDSTLVDTQIIDTIFITPPGPVENTFAFAVETLGGTLTTYEGTTVSANGIQQPTFNKNRNSLNVPGMEFFIGPTITDLGLQTSQVTRPYTGPPGGPVLQTIGGGSNITLKYDTIYLFRFVASGAGELIFRVEWAES